MKTFLFTLFLLLNSFSLAQAGYSVVLKKKPEIPLTVIHASFRVGSADDPKGFEGLAALTARMVREGGVREWNGNPARAREELEKLLFPYAADINVSVEKEQTTLSVTTTPESSEKVFNILSQILLMPAFSEKEFSRLKADTLMALEKRWPLENKEDLGKAALDWWMYGKGHPYSHVVEGTIAGINAINLDKIKTFYTEKYTQKRLTVGLAGVVSPAFLQLAHTQFLKLPAGADFKATLAKASTETTRGEGLRLLLVKVDAETFDAVGAHFGQPISLLRGDQNFAGMSLVGAAFGKHRSFVGRLMKVVRELRSLNYGAYAYIEDFPHGSNFLSPPTEVSRSQQAFTVWVRPVKKDNACFAVRQVYREISNLHREGLTKEEFDLTRGHLLGSLPMWRRGLNRELGYSMDAHFYGLKDSYYDEMVEQVRKTTRKKVHGMIQKYIQPQQMSIVIVTANPDEFLSQLNSAECKITYNNKGSISKEVQKEDELISNYSVSVKPTHIKKIDALEIFAN